ncbi:hypothetical protein Q2941_39970 [Bradyrhizobium sp. UFLA05-153]
MMVLIFFSVMTDAYFSAWRRLLSPSVTQPHIISNPLQKTLRAAA